MATRKRARRTYHVFRLESWEAFLKLVIQAPYSNWAFRGESDERWPLYSSLSRYLQNFAVSPEAWPEQEDMDGTGNQQRSYQHNLDYQCSTISRTQKLLP